GDTMSKSDWSSDVCSSDVNLSWTKCLFLKKLRKSWRKSSDKQSGSRNKAGKSSNNMIKSRDTRGGSRDTQENSKGSKWNLKKAGFLLPQKTFVYTIRWKQFLFNRNDSFSQTTSPLRRYW